MTYQALSTEDVWDVALKRYGDGDAVGWLLEDNTGLVDNDGLVDVAGDALQVRSASWSQTKNTTARDTRNEVVVRQSECVATSQQTIWDIALQQYGDADAIHFLLTENVDLVETNGLVEDGRRRYKLRNEFFNIRMRTRMLELIPSTGTKSQNEAWVTDDGQPWVTDDGQIWVTG